MQTSTNSSITATSILNTINNTNDANESSEHSKIDYLTSVDFLMTADWNKSLFDSSISSDISGDTKRRLKEIEINNLMANINTKLANNNVNSNSNKNNDKSDSNKVRKPTVVSKYYQTICMMSYDMANGENKPLVDDNKQQKLDKEEQHDTKDANHQSSPISTQSFSSVSTSSSPST